METESAIDYYVLFQDLSKYAQRLNHSGESEQREGKGSVAQFLWCYIGKLTARQARGVQTKLDLEFKKKFVEECPWYMDLNELMIKGLKESQCPYGGRIVGRRQASSHVSQCETTKPDVVFLEYTSDQRLKMLQEKRVVARSPQGTEHFVVSKTKAIAPKIWRSFVHLLPFPTLTDMWHRIGCPTDVEPLQCTALVWCRETFWKETISLVGEKACPEEIELVFKSSLDDQKMTVSQREVLKKCVDVANSVREVDGCKDMNIENKYRLAQANIAAPLEVIVKNEEPIATIEGPDSPVVGTIEETNELLKTTNSLIEKGTTINKKGFDSLKPVTYKSLAELVPTLPPLNQEREDENWVTRTTAAKLTQEEVGTLKKQRQQGENLLVDGQEFGRDTKGRIWTKAGSGDSKKNLRKYFYLRETLSGQNISR
jgi:hypothetical protein